MAKKEVQKRIYMEGMWYSLLDKCDDNDAEKTRLLDVFDIIWIKARRKKCYSVRWRINRIVILATASKGLERECSSLPTINFETKYIVLYFA